MGGPDLHEPFKSGSGGQRKRKSDMKPSELFDMIKSLHCCLLGCTGLVSRDAECFVAAEIDPQITASKEMGTLVLQQQGNGIWQNVNKLERGLHPRRA